MGKRLPSKIKRSYCNQHQELYRLKLALEASREGVWDWDLVTDENWVSDNWAHMIGYTVEEVQQTYDFFVKHIHPEDLDRMTRVRDRYLTGQLPEYHTVFRMKAKDGQVKWILSRGRIVAWDEQGNPLRVTGTHQDITRQKKAEEALKRQKAVLQSFFTYSPDAMAHLDIHQRIVQVNNQFSRLFGYTEMECINQRLDELITDEALRQEALEISLRTENNESVYVETERTHKDGTRIPVAIRGGPVFVDGNIEGYQGIYTDITQRKKEEAQIRQAKEKAEAASQIKSRFLSNMSHEIRTPMNGIHGATMLLEATPLNQDQEELVAILKESSNRMVETVNNLLDVSRIESGKMELKDEIFDLKEMVEEVTEPFVVLNHSASLRYQVLMDNQVDARIMGDRSKVSRILYHLVSNAFKFTVEGSVVVRITLVRYDEPIGVYRFQVEDTGIGIQQEDLPKLFHRFYQMDDTYSKPYQGTGLGLAIVQKLVERMGGTVGAESEPGKGSRFFVEVPLKVHDFACERVEDHHEEGLKRLNKSIRILAVEDDDISCALLEKVGRRLGAQVVLARDGLEAIRKLGEANYDLVLMDVQLPDINGLEITSVIRSFEKKFGDRTPIIGLSAHALVGDKERCLAAGMNDYLSKPVDFDKLNGVIHKWVR